jgi:transposase
VGTAETDPAQRDPKGARAGRRGHQPIRDLCRARSDAVDDRRRSRQRIKSFLLRNGYRYKGKAIWSPAHVRYLRELKLPNPAQKIILEDYLCAVHAAQERVERCEAGMRDLLASWQLRPAVEALLALIGAAPASSTLRVPLRGIGLSPSQGFCSRASKWWPP